MSAEIFKKFSKSTLTKRDLILSMLTSTGADLYPYFLILKNTHRASEAELINEHRTKIFSLREAFADNKNTLSDIEKSLQIIHDLLRVQITMISKAPETKWETELFQSYMSEMKMFIFLLQDEQEKS